VDKSAIIKSVFKILARTYKQIKTKWKLLRFAVEYITKMKNPDSSSTTQLTERIVWKTKIWLCGVTQTIQSDPVNKYSPEMKHKNVGKNGQECLMIPLNILVVTSTTHHYMCGSSGKLPPSWMSKFWSRGGARRIGTRASTSATSCIIGTRASTSATSCIIGTRASTFLSSTTSFEPPGQWGYCCFLCPCKQKSLSPQSLFPVHFNCHGSVWKKILDVWRDPGLLLVCVCRWYVTYGLTQETSTGERTDLLQHDSYRYTLVSDLRVLRVSVCHWYLTWDSLPDMWHDWLRNVWHSQWVMSHMTGVIVI